MKSKVNSPHSNREIIPMDLLQIALNRWWIIVLGMCLGGLLGAAIHFLIPPVYQTQAVISAGIDFARTGKLSDVEEDYIIKKVGDLIESDAVIDETLLSAEAQGIELDEQTFDEMRYLQRSFNDWLLVVRSQDAQQAEVLANLWVEAAWAALTQASEHLVKQDAYEVYLVTQTRCRDLQLTTSLGTVCYLSSVSDLDTQIEETVLLIEEEKTAAQGLVSGIVINLTERADVPSAPQILGRNTLVLVGALLGLLISCLTLFVWKKEPFQTQTQIQS